MTRQYVIPESFFKSIYQKDKLYARIWFYWLSNHIDNLFDQDFVEGQEKAFPKVKELREVYSFGIELLEDFRIIEKKTKKAQRKPISKEHRAIANQVIDYLNQQAETTFEKKGKSIELVVDRIKEGYGIAELKNVIDKKVRDWKGTDWATYLRPITLFAKTKFETYLNGAEKGATTNFQKFADSVRKAQQSFALRSNK